MFFLWGRRRTLSCSIQSRGPVEPWASWWQLRFGLFQLGSGWGCATRPCGDWMASVRCLQRSLLTKRIILWKGYSIRSTRLLLWPALWLTTPSLTRWGHVHTWAASMLCFMNFFTISSWMLCKAAFTYSVFSLVWIVPWCVFLFGVVHWSRWEHRSGTWVRTKTTALRPCEQGGFGLVSSEL